MSVVSDSFVHAVLITPTQRNVKIEYESWPDVAKDRFCETDCFDDTEGCASFLAQIYGLRVTVVVKAVATAGERSK